MFFWNKMRLNIFETFGSIPGVDAEILKRMRGGGALYVGHHGLPVKKILGFRYSKKPEITLETVSF